MRRIALFLCVASTWLVVSSAVADPPAPAQVWEFRDGYWQNVASAVAQAVESPQLDRIEALIGSGEYKQARTELKEWDKANKQSPARPRALMLFARMYDAQGDKIRAFYHLDELLETYPDSRLYYPAVEMQYRIAEQLLEGYNRRVFGLSLGSAKDRGVEMMYRIQQRVPGSPLAERALLRTADHYYQEGDFDFAADAYAAYVRNYPRSPLASRARLREAYANLAQFHGTRFDPTPLLDARTELREIAQADPALAQEVRIPETIAKIDEALAKKIAYRGDFYRRTGQPRASEFAYLYLADQFPDTAAAEGARERAAAVAEMSPPPERMLPTEAPVAAPDRPTYSGPSGESEPR